MFDLFQTKLDKKYVQALKWSENAQNIYQAPIRWNLFVEGGTPKELHKLARIAVVHHHCWQPKGSMWFAEYVRLETGKDFHQLLNDSVLLGDKSLIDRLRKSFEKKHPTKLTPYGKFLKRRQKSIWKDFPNMHEILIKEMKELDAIIRQMILDIRKGKSFPDGIDFYDLICKRTRIACLKEFYYDCSRDLSDPEGFLCTNKLIGNDGAVSYSVDWVLDNGLWQVFNHYKVDPLPIATQRSGWFQYLSKVQPIGFWWLFDWNPDYMKGDENWELAEDEQYLLIA